MLLLSAALAATPMEHQLTPLVAPALEADALQGAVIGLFSAGSQEVIPYGDVKTTTAFEIGSVSKALNGLLLAEALRRGELKLDDPVSEHVSFALPTHKGHPIRVVHLATHTSGLPRMPASFAPADASDPYRDIDTAALEASLTSSRLEGEPGTHYAYSNLGAALLGRVLSEVGGKPWETLMEERVFEPLGMKRCTIDDSKLPQGHDIDGEPVSSWTLNAFAPAGGIECTVGDLMLLVQASFDTTHPMAPAFALATQAQEDLGTMGGIGLGWHLTPQGVIWHNGQTGGFHSLVAMHPQRGLGVVLLANTATPIADEIGFGALELLAGQRATPPAVRTPVSVPPESLSARAGTYGPATVTFRDGKLFMALPDQPAVRLWPESDSSFFLRAAPASARFEGDTMAFMQEGVPRQTWSRE